MLFAINVGAPSPRKFISTKAQKEDMSNNNRSLFHWRRLPEQSKLANKLIRTLQEDKNALKNETTWQRLITSTESQTVVSLCLAKVCISFFYSNDVSRAVQVVIVEKEISALLTIHMPSAKSESQASKTFLSFSCRRKA